MYSLYKEDGTKLGYTESLRYISIGENGCYTNAAKQNAVGIAYHGIAYNLVGHDEIDGEIVLIHEFDGGERLADIEEANELLEEMVEYVAEAVDVSLDSFVNAGDPEDIIPNVDEETSSNIDDLEEYTPSPSFEEVDSC